MSHEQDPLVVSTRDACLHQSDLETLKHDEWLGDNVLAFHAEWLESLGNQLNDAGTTSQVKMFPPSVVELLCTLDEASADDAASIVPKPSKRFLILPVSDRYSPSTHGHTSGGSHWSVLVIDAAKGVGYHLDSLGDINRTAADAVHHSISKLLGSRNASSAEARKVDCLEHQANSSDCGIYVLLLSSLLHRHLCSSSASPDLIQVIQTVCADSTPDNVGRFRQAYLDWLQVWGNATHHQEHVDPNEQVKARFEKLFSDLNVK